MPHKQQASTKRISKRSTESSNDSSTNMKNCSKNSTNNSISSTNILEGQKRAKIGFFNGRRPKSSSCNKANAATTTQTAAKTAKAAAETAAKRLEGGGPEGQNGGAPKDSLCSLWRLLVGISVVFSRLSGGILFF